MRIYNSENQAMAFVAIQSPQKKSIPPEYAKKNWTPISEEYKIINKIFKEQ